MRSWTIGDEKSKKKAKRIYAKIGRVPCPAFGGEFVAFNSAGFNHLVRKGRIPRTRNEQKRRFALIPYVEGIIRNLKANIFYERRETKNATDRHGDKIIIKSVANFWTFVDTISGYSVKVVIRQLDTDGPKHFFSVMSNTFNKQVRKIKKSR